MARPAPGADRSVAVLEMLAAHPDERFTLSEVARRCGLNKATAHALLTALTEHGVLLRHPQEKRYSLGPRLLAIGDAARRGYTAADFAPAAVDELAAATGRVARAWRTTPDHLVRVAQAPGGGPAEAPRPVPVPLVPPIGAAAIAWGDPPTVEAWLARAVATEAVQPALAALPGIRRRGYAVTLAPAEWRALTDPAAGELRGDTVARRSLLQAIARGSQLAADLDGQPPGTGPVVDVSAPVFGAGGGVVLVLSLTASAADGGPTLDVRSLGAQVRDAAEALTAAVCGRAPDRPT